MELAPRLIYRSAISLVVFLLIVVMLIIPLGRSAYNSIFGDKVTIEYKATVVSIEGDTATIEWTEDEMFVLAKGNTYVMQSQEIDLNKYKHVKIGDTFILEITEPGLLKKVGSEEQRAVEVKKHNINFFKSIWRKFFG
ncbi:hypothetical protein ABEO75_23545 [Paenibacillus macerans]|uniref:hypothetical protein n=1 Tax=Paenibacillus macerans TaxID=44252 RepID=UPI002E1DC80C|nr:hypothetical protein [Paenibacillus macerans]